MTEFSFNEICDAYGQESNTGYAETEKENLKALWKILARGMIENDIAQLDQFGTLSLGKPKRVGSKQMGYVENVRKVKFQAAPAFEELLAKIWLELKGEAAEFR